jgi:hypothetical protein
MAHRVQRQKERLPYSHRSTISRRRACTLGSRPGRPLRGLVALFAQAPRRPLAPLLPMDSPSGFSRPHREQVLVLPIASLWFPDRESPCSLHDEVAALFGYLRCLPVVLDPGKPESKGKSSA